MVWIRARRVLSVSAAGLLLSLLWMLSAGAQTGPMIEIRARTLLRMQEVSRTTVETARSLRHAQGTRPAESDQRVTLRLGLQDNAPPASTELAAGETSGFHNRSIHLVVERADPPTPGQAARVLDRTVSTDANGIALATLPPLPLGRYRVQAQFAGDALRDAAAAQLELHLSREPTVLHVEVPKTLLVGQPLEISGLRVELVQKGPRTLAPGPIRLRVLSESTELSRRQVMLPTTASERVILHPFPPPGTVLRVEAHYPGSPQDEPTETTASLQVVSQAQVSLQLRAKTPLAALDPELVQGSPLTIEGTVTDQVGPLRGEPVDIEATVEAMALPGPAGEAARAAQRTQRVLGTVLTDEHGGYSLNIAQLSLPIGLAHLVARVVPNRAYILPATSMEQRVQVAPPAPVPLGYFLIPLLISLLGVGLVLAGQRVWPHVRTLWLRLARRPAPVPPPSVLVPKKEAAAVTPGITLGQRAALTLRRTVESTIDGTVTDAVFGHAVPFAQITLSLLDTSRRVPTDQETPYQEVTTATGAFQVHQIRLGRYTLAVHAPGYLGQTLVTQVPHRGELRGIRVQLMPLRACLLSEWRRVAQTHCPDISSLRTRTPADLLAEVSLAPPSAAQGPPLDLPSLARLTELVNTAYYAPRVCSQEMLEEAIVLRTGLLTKP